MDLKNREFRYLRVGSLPVLPGVHLQRRPLENLLLPPAYADSTRQVTVLAKR